MNCLTNDVKNCHRCFHELQDGIYDILVLPNQQNKSKTDNQQAKKKNKKKKNQALNYQPDKLEQINVWHFWMIFRIQNNSLILLICNHLSQRNRQTLPTQKKSLTENFP